MARGAPENLTLRLSVLDRLLDDEPGLSREPPLPPHQAIRQAIAAVRRDLENLLNTRQTWLDDSVLDREAVSQSIAAYGLPDFSGAGLDASDSRKLVQRAIERAIKTFEPRLSTVVVKAEAAQADKRELRFRIDAVLYVDPVREPVSFDTVVQSTGVAQVTSI